MAATIDTDRLDLLARIGEEKTIELVSVFHKTALEEADAIDHAVRDRDWRGLEAARPTSSKGVPATSGSRPLRKPPRPSWLRAGPRRSRRSMGCVRS